LKRIIHTGDWIRVNDDLEGRVTKIGWRQTSIETRTRYLFLLPNSELAQTKVEVVERTPGFPVPQRRWIFFKVDLNHSSTNVIATVETALRAEAIPSVATSPQAHCVVTDMKNGAGTYAVRYWLTDVSQTDSTDSLVRTLICTALQRARINPALSTQAILSTEEKSVGGLAENAEFEQPIGFAR
jgi:small-conductance mechanosensitive channel